MDIWDKEIEIERTNICIRVLQKKISAKDKKGDPIKPKPNDLFHLSQLRKKLAELTK